MNNLLEQAQAAANAENWSELSQCLQQFALDNKTQSQANTETLLPLALAVLQSGDFQERWDIAKVFPSFGDAAINPLATLLQDSQEDLEVRWFTARILGQFDHPIAIATLVNVLQQTEDEDLSLVAAEALAQKGAAAIEALTRLLSQQETRFLATQALVRIQHPATLEPLLSVVEDVDPAIRTLAIESISQFHAPHIPPILMRAIQDPAPTVRQTAIANIRPGWVDSEEWVSLLSDRLWDLNLEVCQQAAIALGRLGTDTAIAALSRCLASPLTPPPLQQEVVRAISWSGTSMALQVLQQAITQLKFSDDNRAILQEIISLLGRWETPALKPLAVQILIDLLSANPPVLSDPQLQQLIALALGHLKQEQALQPLIQLLAVEDLGVRLHAIAALKAIAPDLAAQQLQQLSINKDLPDGAKQGIRFALQEMCSVEKPAAI